MTQDQSSAAAIDPALLDILACPACRSALQVRTGENPPGGAASGELVCTNTDCRRAYPIRDGIPILLIDESRVLPAE